jgi:hypothetical protein
MSYLVKNIRGVNSEKDAIITAALNNPEARRILAEAMVAPHGPGLRYASEYPVLSEEEKQTRAKEKEKRIAAAFNTAEAKRILAEARMQPM